MFINHKMTHRYIYFRFTRHALQLHHVTMLNYLHGYKRLCCQNLAYRQTEIKWSFFVEHYALPWWNLNSKEKVNGIFLSKTLNVLQSEVHFLVHKMLDFRSFRGALPPEPLTALGRAPDPRPNFLGTS
jgi:hypothetical protein